MLGPKTSFWVILILKAVADFIVNNVENNYRFACLDNTVIKYRSFETYAPYCSVPMWTRKFETNFPLLHMGMTKMDYLPGTVLVWTLTDLGYFIYKLLTYENKESSFCSQSLA